MSATTFCSACGEKIGRTHGRTPWLAPFCRRCRRRPRLSVLAPLALLGCGALLGFFTGRLTAPRQPFTFIGTPIDRQGERDASAGDGKDKAREPGSEPTQTAAAETFSVCGAPTKSGHPCRRKVRGGGYCWQHKGTVKPAAPAQNRVAPRESRNGKTLRQDQ